MFVHFFKHSRIGSVVTQLDLDGEVLDSSTGYTNNFKIVLTAPNSVRVREIPWP